MQRKIISSIKEKMLARDIKAKKMLNDLPQSIYLSVIFPYLCASDLTRLKKVSHTLKSLSDTYLERTTTQIFYACSDGQVEIGKQTMLGPYVTNTINKNVTELQLIYAFKYATTSESSVKFLNHSFEIFRTEIEALKRLLTTRDPTGCHPRLFSYQWINEDNKGDHRKILVTPIYKVQLIHSKVRFRYLMKDKFLSVQQFKESNESHHDRVFVDTANILPLSASVKFSFFKTDPLRTLVENVEFKKMDKKTEQTSFTSSSLSGGNKCLIM